MLAISLMVFGAMCVLTGLVIGTVVLIEYLKEQKWLKSYLSRRK